MGGGLRGEEGGETEVFFFTFFLRIFIIIYICYILSCKI